MNKRSFILIGVVLTVGVALITWFVVYFSLSSTPTPHKARAGKPNIIILLADDTGYADFQTFGHPTQEWTGIDRMAKEGMKFTNWYVPASMCSPSRAALLTGRYPVRLGMFGYFRVFAAMATGGLPKREVTIAETLKQAGYATGMVGKWHLGINQETSTDGAHLPHHHGFEYVGTILPFTQMRNCNPKKYTISEMRICFLYQNDSLIEQPINLGTLTSRLVEDAKAFIRKNKDRPFFFYLSFPQTHAALFSDPRFAGKSRRGPYGDNVNEMGWGVNEILDQLIENQIEKDTLVIFLSDHGPELDGCGEGGTAGVFRGGKSSTWEGGVRVPAVAWWPGTVPPSTINHVTVSSMDLLPTASSIAGLGNYFEENNILVDGKVIDDVIKGKTEKSPHDILFFYCSGLLMSVRYQRYKIHYYTFPEKVYWDDIGGVRCDYTNLTWYAEVLSCERNSKKQIPPLIFDVETDPGEQVILDPNLPENQILLEIVDDLIKTHEASIVPVQTVIQNIGPFNELVPCCNPPHCSCNYDENNKADSLRLHRETKNSLS